MLSAWMLPVTLVALVACGTQDGAPDAGVGGAAAQPDAGDSGAAGDGGSGGAMEGVNGCTELAAEDHTRAAATIITASGASYSPRCVRIRAQSTVTVVGPFASHPLVGGLVTEDAQTPDPSSPVPPTSSGTEVSFVVAVPGAYGYYCDFHASIGMMGAIFAE